MSNEVTTFTVTTQPAEKPVQSTPATASRRSLTMDQAYEEIQAEKGSRSLDSQRTETREPESADVPADARWTNEDVQTLSALQNRAKAYWQGRQTLQQGLTLVAQAEAGLAQIADKGQLEARRTEIRAAKADLERQAKILVAEEQLINSETLRLRQTQLAREAAKLPADYDREANRREMQERGYSAVEIANVTLARDAQIIDDARRWREHIAGRKPRPLPKVPRPKGAQTPQVAPADETSLWDNKNPLHRRRGEVAHARLKRTGSLDDALAVLRQKRIAARAQP